MQREIEIEDTLPNEKRKPSKIEKYLIKLLKGSDSKMITCERSSYYRVGSNVIRVSDHIGKNSSGSLSIIIPSSIESNGLYVLHSHSSGRIVTTTYERLKELIRSYVYFSDLLGGLNGPSEPFKLPNEDIPCGNGEIMGVPIGKFSKKQVNMIKLFVRQIDK